jgi:hypothetical protein
VAEGRVADVVDESEGFGEVFVEAKDGGGGAGDLGDLDGVSEAAAEVIGDAAGEDLSFACEPTEGTRLHDPLAVTLEGRARWAIGRGKDTLQERYLRFAGYGQIVQVSEHVRLF